jgi:glycerol-3-phosphate dehydrogenase
MGGKWTAFRVQGEQTVDRILKDHPEDFKHIKYLTGQTLNFNLIGSYGRVEIIEGV